MQNLSVISIIPRALMLICISYASCREQKLLKHYLAQRCFLFIKAAAESANVSCGRV